MAVATVTQWAVTPGKQEEFLPNVARAKKIHQRLGGQVRVLQNTFGGENTGRISYVIEHSDLAAFASFSQQMQADAEWQQLWASVNSGSPAATMISNSLLAEPAPSNSSGAQGGSRPGAAMVVVALRPTPGRLQEALASVAEAGRILSAAGAQVRVWQATIAGSQAGSLLATSELADMSSFATAMQKLQSGTEWRQFQQRAGAAGHATVVSQSLYIELPAG